MSDPLDIEEGLFWAALARPEPERATFIREIAAERPAVAERIVALLHSHGRTNLLEAPKATAAPLVPTGPIGRYTVGEKLGEGGVGIVFRAEQSEPFRREVALKVVKPGMDTAEVIARFESERQALALMDHPHIARVFDAGATQEGRPYFVMELVSGPPITRFCDEQRLPLASRLSLFIKVCHAVHHAHGKGIIHRDLKGSNILVANHEGELTPKVIDFGIAKATAHKLTERTLVTLVPRFMGTPSHMSPEQAAENGGEVDARTDVYSLGVLLCELVTGRTPLGSRALHGSYEEIRRRICEDPVPGLGELLRQLDGPALDVAAKLRQTDASGLLRAAERELSWIAQRCLAKDRAGRYPTARALAEDVQRYLRRERVEARPPARLDVLKGRLRGQRVVRWMGSAAAAAFEGFAKRRATASRSAGSEPRAINVEAHRLVLEGRRHWNRFTEEGFVRAQAAFDRALAVSPGYAMALAGLAYVAGRRAILAVRASRHIEPMIAMAEQHARSAIAEAPNMGEPHSVLGAVALLRGRHAEAIAHLEQALQINANSDLAWAYLSRVHMCQGRPDLAIPELENARLLSPIPILAWHRGLAALLARRYHEALAVLEEVERGEGASASTRAQLAVALAALGRPDQALARARTVLDPAGRSDWTVGMNAVSDGLAAWVLASHGAIEEARQVVAGILALPPPHHYAAGFATALLGDRARAFELLADTPEWIHDHVLLFEHETNCFGADPGFERLLRRLGALESWRSVRRIVDGVSVADEKDAAW